MANEFIARKGLIVSGSTNVSGSVTAHNFTGSLYGTASYATQALSASWAPGGGGGGSVGPGTTNVIAKFNSSTTIGDSNLTDTGTSISSSVPITASAFSGNFYGNGSGITNLSINVDIDAYKFTADGVETQYTISQSYGTEALFVTVNGVNYISPEDYTISGATITFTETPYSQSNIFIRGFATRSLLETASFSTTASYVLPSGLPTGTVSSSTQVNYLQLQNIPSGIVSSSTQATTWTVATASYVDYPNVANKPTLVSASSQVDVRNTTGIATIATTGSNTFTGVQNISNTTNSTSYIDGALIVAGGVGISKNVNISGSVNILGLLTVVSMSSQYVTSSQYNVGVSKITLNDDDTVRFAGLSIYDSGSASPATASIFWDSLQHRFIYENLSGSAYNSAVIIAGPKNTGSLGSERELTVNRFTYATGGDHIDDAPARVVGTDVHIDNNLYVSGSLTASAGISGTSSFATTASYVQPTGLPAGTVSSSGQVSYLGLSNIPANIVSSSAQVVAFLPVGTISSSAQVQLNTISGVTFSNAAFLFPQDVTVGGDLIVSGNDIRNNRGDDVITFRGTNNLDVRITSGALDVWNGEIRNSGMTAIQMNGQNVDVLGRLRIYGDEVRSSTNQTALTLSGNNISTPGSASATGGFVGNLTGSVLGTSSWATNAITASFATTASAATSITFTPSTASYAISASNALTSSYALNAGAGAGFPFSGSAVITGSLLVSSSGIQLTGAGLTGSVLGTSSWASNAITASNALTASYAINAGAGAGFPFSGSAVITGSLLVIATGSVGGITGSFSGSGAGLTDLRASIGIDSYTFVGDGSTTNYILSQSYIATSLIVSVEGIGYITPNDYTLSGPTMSFVAAPPSESNVSVKAFLAVSSGSYINYTGSFIGDGYGLDNLRGALAIETNVFTGNGSTSSYTLSGSYQPESVLVTVGGLRYINPNDYSLTGSTLNFVQAPPSESVVVAQAYLIVSSGSVGTFSGSFIGNGTLTSSGHFTPAVTDIYDLGSPTKKWRSLYVSGSTIYLGSLELKDSGGTFSVASASGVTLPVSGTFTGSFFGTSSWASNAISSSYAVSSSYTVTSSYGVSSSYALSSSYAVSSSYGVTSSYAVSASYATTGSYAVTSSYAVSSSYAFNATTASFANNVLKTKAGSVANSSFGGSPLTASVTFSTAFDNTNYAIAITGEDSRAWIVQSKTTGGFTINSVSNTALTGTTYWTCTAYGEN